MSLANAKTQLASALTSVTWSIPASAAGIANPILNTQFKTIGSQQFAGEENAIASDALPYVRISIPDGDEKRMTDLGDAASEKVQTFTAHLFIYQVGFTKDWQGLADYFDAVVDATLAYFRRNSAPQGAGVVTAGTNDMIRSWGLHQRWRVELPDQYGALLTFRATVAVDIKNVIV